MVLGTAMQTYGEKLTDEQEVLMLAADIIIDVFAAESVLLRAERRRGAAARSRTWRLARRRAQVFVTDAAGAGRDRRAHGARGDDRGRHAADAARRAAAAAEGRARSTPSRSAGRSPTSWSTEGVSVLNVSHGCAVRSLALPSEYVAQGLRPAALARAGLKACASSDKRRLLV